MTNKRVLVKPARKTFVEDLKREVTVDKGAVHFVEDNTKDYSTRDGTIRKEDLQKTEGTVQTTKGAEYAIFEQSFIDEYRGLRRLAQTIHRKDIGFIIAETGINKNSVIAEAGTGSAGLSCFLAPLVKQIHSFDSNDTHLDMAKQNLARLNIKNVTLHRQDVYQAIPVQDCDLFVLDLPEPWQALPHAIGAVRPGGFIINYSPSITQAQQCAVAAEKHANLLHLKTVEIIERPWKLSSKVARPASQMLNHTAFISVFRKIQ